MNDQAAEEQKFPQTNIQVNPQGVKVIFTLAPGYETSITLAEETVNKITKMWVQYRKNIADQLRVIQHVNSSKINE